MEVRERIRIDGELISKEKFIDYFWICYNTIHNAVQKSTAEVIQSKYIRTEEKQLVLGSNTITFLFLLSNNDDVLHIRPRKGLLIDRPYSLITWE